MVIVTAPAGGDPAEGCLTRGRELVAQVVHIARELSDTDGQPPRLYVITRNAQAVTPHDRVNLDQGGVRGLLRVIGAEQAPLRATQIDVDPRTAADQLAQELLSGSDEDETAWREGLWYTARLRRTPLQAEERRTTLADPESDGMRLQIRTPGDLQTLELVAAERPAPAAGQVEVAVSASSINFADVLAAFGRYPTFDGKQPQLGLDFAGVVTAVGPGVTEYRVGDRVGGFGAGGCWGTYVTCDARLVAPLPAGLTAEEAAAVSTGYVTAWYGLCDLARIGPGDRVLIHSATGGVGQAAIAIARQAGAEIFATAGSPGRRQLLRDMGIEHVYDSRSTDFADEIRRDTDGYGVDVVLNSLIGPAQRAGLELLAFGGRFVEIGKRDVYEHTRVDLYPFRRNLAFYYADLALMTINDPKRIGALLRKVYELVGDGVLPVPEHTAYPLTEAATAIRTISAAEHTGKLVLSVPQEWIHPGGGAAESGAGLPQRRLLPCDRWGGRPWAVPGRGDGLRRMRTNRPDLSISTESTGAEDDCAAAEQRSRHRGGVRQHRRPGHRGATRRGRHRHRAAAARRPACRGRRRRRYRWATSPTSSSSGTGRRRFAARGTCIGRPPISPWTGSATSPRRRCCWARQDRARTRRPTAGWTPSRHGNAAKEFRPARSPGARGPTSAVAPVWRNAVT